MNLRRPCIAIALVVILGLGAFIVSFLEPYHRRFTRALPDGALDAQHVIIDRFRQQTFCMRVKMSPSAAREYAERLNFRKSDVEVSWSEPDAPVWWDPASNAVDADNVYQRVTVYEEAFIKHENGYLYLLVIPPDE